MDNIEFPESDIQSLIVRYLEGSASDTEILCLQEWLSQTKENFALFEEYGNYWLQAGVEGYRQERAWQRLNRRLEKRAEKRYLHWGRLWIGYAALLFLFLSLGYYMWQISSSSDSEWTRQENIQPGSKKAFLVLSSNEKIDLNDSSTDSLLVKRVGVKKEENTLIYQDNPAMASQIDYNRLVTPRGGEYSVVLSDGTRVWLNAESELKYPVRFTKTERKVFLKGEAYFSVTQRPGQTFVVCSDKARIIVMGTEFNVKNYEGNVVAATLVKGSVIVAHEKGETRKLQPGQQAMIDKTGDIEVKEVETILYTAWKDGYFVYQNKTLDDILQELSRWYDFTYFYQNSALENLTLTAKLRKFDSVEKIFEILSATGRFELVTKGRTVTVVAK